MGIVIIQPKKGKDKKMTDNTEQGTEGNAQPKDTQPKKGKGGKQTTAPHKQSYWRTKYELTARVNKGLQLVLAFAAGVLSEKLDLWNMLSDYLSLSLS